MKVVFKTNVYVDKSCTLIEYIYILTEREVRMGEYWSSSLFYVFMDRAAGEVHTHVEKENETNIPPYGPSAKSINDLLYCYKRELFLYLSTKQSQ